MRLTIGSLAQKLSCAIFLLFWGFVALYSNQTNAQAGLPPGACNGFTASAQTANTTNNVAAAQALRRNSVLYSNCTRAKQLIDATRPALSPEETAWARANSCETVTAFMNRYPRSRHLAEAASRKARICVTPPNCNEYAAQIRDAASRQNMAALRLLRGQSRNFQACGAARAALTSALASSSQNEKQRDATKREPPDLGATPADPPQVTPEPVPMVIVVEQAPPITAPNSGDQTQQPNIPAPVVTSDTAPTTSTQNAGNEVAQDAAPETISPVQAADTTPMLPMPSWLYRPIGPATEGGALYYSNSFAEALPILQSECTAQNWGSCALLGSIYGDGLGVAIDFDRAFSFSRMSCDHSVMLGCVFLGYRYLQSDGTEANILRAADLFKRSCDAGEPDGCNALAEAYRNGNGIERDIEQSETLYGRAVFGFSAYCDAGRTSYCGSLGSLYLHGYGVEKNETEAQALFKKGCDGKDQTSCYLLGETTKIF